MANMSAGVMRYVCGIVLCGDSVLLLRKSKPEWQEGRLNFMGGKVEAGETFADAMSREGDEELGLNFSREIRNWRYLASEDGPGYSCAYFVGVLDPAMIALSPSQNDTGEKYEWHPITALPRDMIGNCRWLIAMALDPRAELRAEITVAGEISRRPTWAVTGPEAFRG